MKLKIAVVAAVVAASTLTGAFAQGSPAATVSTKTDHLTVCARSADPYREPVSVLRSCGAVILRLQHVTPLPGGGKAYDYGAYTQLLPPPHFNVLKASDRQLREYALPTRQEFGARWYGLVRHMRSFVKPVPYLVEIPTARNTVSPARALSVCSYCSFNWEGYVANAGHVYTGASAAWDEPDFVSTPCSNVDTAQWVGIGGYNGSPDLGQDGTIFGYPLAGSHQGWIEANDPGGSIVPIAKLYATIDKKFIAVTTWDSSTTKYNYSMTNDWTGKTWSGTSEAVGSNNDLSSAEVITERTTNGGGNGGYYNLTNFQNFQVLNSSILADGTWTTFNNLPNSDQTLVDMVDHPNGTNLMAYPGTLNSSSGFTNTWNHCD
jgi:hypothetical protein